MKRILIFSLAYYPRHVSGAEAAVKEVTDRVEDIEFHMMTLRWDARDVPEELIGRVRVFRVGWGTGYLSKITFPLAAAFAARRLSRTHEYSALWAIMTYMLLPVRFATLLGVRVPHIATLQDGDAYEKVFGRVRILPFLPLLDWGLRHARVIQVISTYLATWPARRGSTVPIELIHNGANPKDIRGAISEEEVETVRKAIGKKDGDVWLVNTARLEPQKGNDTTIRALPLLPDTVHLLLVGGGTEEEQLRALADSLGVSARVYFAGQVTRDQVTAYRKAADIFVGPSRSEGLGNAFLSAMASRLPVVATREGGLADFLFSGREGEGVLQTGWVVQPDQPEQIAEAVRTILSHPSEVADVTARARQMVVEKFDWDAIARQMRTQVFSRVI